MKLLRDLDFEGKRVFVRCDLDVPLGKDPKEFSVRLLSAQKTLSFIRQNEAKLVIAGHIGRPVREDETLSTKRLVEPLSQIVEEEVLFAKDLDNAGNFEVVLLENLRFFPGEATNDLEFAKKLANLADFYVNESFANCHRAHASMVAVPSLLPYAAGFHLEEEVEVLSKILQVPTRPLVALIGGAKLETKIPVITNLAKVAHHVLVGGLLPVEIKNKSIPLPENVVVAELENDTKDITIDAANRFARIIKGAKTVVWNGPMGLFEHGYTKGSEIVTQAILDSKAYSILGGGELVEFVRGKHNLSRFSFVSTGGGAMLEFLAGKTLPGIKAME